MGILRDLWEAVNRVEAADHERATKAFGKGKGTVTFKRPVAYSTTELQFEFNKQRSGQCKETVDGKGDR